MHAENSVIVDGATLSCAAVAAVARQGARVTVAPGNGHGLRLLRSHAGGAGEPLSAAVARGALAILLNQHQPSAEPHEDQVEKAHGHESL